MDQPTKPDTSAKPGATTSPGTTVHGTDVQEINVHEANIHEANIHEANVHGITHGAMPKQTLLKKNKFIGIALPFVFILVCLLVSYLFFANPPVAQQKSNRQQAPLKINTISLKAQDYPIVIRAYGVVKPRFEATLIPQVAGMIVSTSENFLEGGRFQKGETLITIDHRDYENALTVAQASFTQAEFRLKEEQARTDQAKVNWQRLGKKGAASELVLRLPQLSVAQAALASAKAQMNQAQLDLERTRIIAPYHGRVLTKTVDVGQVVSKGSVLASIYATDTLEIRLPINNQQLQFLDIPNNPYPPNQQSKQPPINNHYPQVTFRSASSPSLQWQGEIIRAEGSIDIKSRQLFVIAEINPVNNSNDSSDPFSALKIGQFIAAEIQGKVLPNVFVIPRENLYKGNSVWIVKNDKLATHKVQPLWKNDDVVLVQGNLADNGLSENEQLVTTPLLSAVSGRRVIIVNPENEH